VEETVEVVVEWSAVETPGEGRGEDIVRKWLTTRSFSQIDGLRSMLE
jgi:hypothetical protein